jgi:hypothetical protein
LGSFKGFQLQVPGLRQRLKFFPVHNQTEHVKAVWCHQFEFCVPGATQNVCLIGFLAVDAGAFGSAWDTKPDRVWPDHALLSDGVAGVFDEQLNAIKMHFVNASVKAATADLIVLLVPLGQVVGVFIGITGG